MIINKINIYDVLCSYFNIMYEGFFLHGRKGLWLVVGTGIFRGEKSVCVQGGADLFWGRIFIIHYIRGNIKTIFCRVKSLIKRPDSIL